MIKNYRNGLLAAAIALVAVGCDGGAKSDDPLSDPQFVDDLITGGAAGTKPARAIAQLLGDTLSSLIGQTGGVFDTLATVTSPNSNAGKLLSHEVNSSPSGAVTEIQAPCSNGGFFNLDVQLDILKDGEGQTGTPDIANGLADFPNGVVDIALGMNFDKCNEPKHTYDGDQATSPVDPDATQILDGSMVIRAKSDNNVKDASGAVINNDKDFLMNGSISMKDYFIQKGEPGAALDPVELITGDVSFTLSTTNNDSGVYKASLGFDVTTNDSSGGSTRANISADGTLTLNDLAIAGYNLSITNGSLRNTGGAAAGAYDLLTQAPLVSTDGGNPSAGMIAIIDKQSGLMHTAEVTGTGVTFNIYEEGKTDPVVSSCTWNQVNNVNGEECLVN